MDQLVSDKDFYDHVVSKVEGWLERFAAFRTMELLHSQEKENIKGGLLEIGVFKGRYLSILARSGARTNSRVLGIDTFEYCDPSSAENLCKTFPQIGNVDFAIWRKRSDICTADQILEHLRGRPRFVSIDGDHKKDAVYLDLCLAEELSAENTIVAVDDFLNPLAIGVNEAAHLYFSRPRILAPFAYTMNKLFLCHRSSAEKYKNLMEELIAKDETDPIAANFRKMRADSRGFIEQPLWGSNIIVS